MPGKNFGDKAAQEIFDLHVVLEDWFNGRGAEDPAVVLAHFDPGFRIVSPFGKAMSFADFAAALPKLRGSRPGLRMEISDVETRRADDAIAVVAYRETQTQGETRTCRLSTACLLAAPGTTIPQWLHLQETWTE